MLLAFIHNYFNNMSNLFYTTDLLNAGSHNEVPHLIIEREIYEWTKQRETAGFNQDFIDEIYDMPKHVFVQNVLNCTLPEMDKIPIPPGTKFPVVVSINNNPLTPPVLVRTLTQVPDTFHEWLYQFRFMLQYFTIEEMFNIFHIYDFEFGVNEPNAWVDNALEQMYYAIPVNEDTNQHTSATIDEFEFNLDWDIEKGSFNNSTQRHLSLFLPEEVGMSENNFYKESP